MLTKLTQNDIIIKSLRYTTAHEILERRIDTESSVHAPDRELTLNIDNLIVKQP